MSKNKSEISKREPKTETSFKMVPLQFDGNLSQQAANSSRVPLVSQTNVGSLPLVVFYPQLLEDGIFHNDPSNLSYNLIADNIIVNSLEESIITISIIEAALHNELDQSGNVDVTSSYPHFSRAVSRILATRPELVSHVLESSQRINPDVRDRFIQCMRRFMGVPSALAHVGLAIDSVDEEEQAIQSIVADLVLKGYLSDDQATDYLSLVSD